MCQRREARIAEELPTQFYQYRDGARLDRTARMTDKPDIKRPIDTSLPFNDQLESSSPSAKTTAIVLGGIVAAIGAITLIVKLS
jgi:hypothetical protein